MNNRISSAVAIELDGGAFEYVSRGAMTDSITLGNLSLTGGSSTLRVNPGNGGFGAATLNLGGTFSRSTGATLNFTSGAGIVGAGANFTATAAGLNTNTNRMIGGWATVNTTDGTTAAANLEFAVYDPIVGVRQMNLVEQSTTFLASTATSNLRIAANGTINNGGQTINSLTIHGATTVSFTGTTLDTLTLASGGLLTGSDAQNRVIGATTNVNTRGRITSSGPELFIHNGANTLTINSDLTGATNPVFTSGGTVGGAAINLTNANTYSGTAYSNGVILLLNNQTGSGNSITGDLVLTGGNINGGDTGAVANATTRNLGSQQIADTATVTVRGGALWDLNGFNETISKLAFNSQGGISGSATILTGGGALTLTNAADTIATSNLDDVRVIPTLNGRLNLPSTATITVADVAGGLTAVAGTAGQSNRQIGLALNSNILSSGTINKEGAGVLQLGGYSFAANTFNINNGTVVLGPSTNTAASNYKSSQLNLNAANTVLDMRGNTNIAIGSVVSAQSTSIIKNFNVSTGGVLVVGSDNTSGTFAGTFLSDYTSGLLGVTKIGTGTWTLTGDSSANLLGTLTLLNGTTALDQATGKLGFVITNLGEGGVLTLNGTGTLSDRLGGSTSIQSATADRAFNNRGGVLNYTSSTAGTFVENLNSVTNIAGQSQWNLTQNGTTQTRINLGTMTAQSGANQGSLVLNAGTGLLGVSAAGVTAAPGANRVSVIATTPTLVGGTGAAGTKTMGIRPDIIGIDATGTGFVTHEATGGFRLLDAADEYQTLPTTGEGLGAFYRGTSFTAAATTSGTIWFPGASTSGLVVGQATTAAFGTIPSGALITAMGTDTVSFSFASTAITGALARFNYNLPANTNAVTAGSVSVQNASSVNSLTLNSGGGIGYFGGGNLTVTSSPNGQQYGYNGALNTLTIASGGIIANAGNTGFSGGSISGAANPLNFHVLGAATTLSVGSTILGTGGIVKSGEGTATLTAKSFNTGATTVNNGTLKLGTGVGPNALLVIPTATVPTLAVLNVNSGFFDLNGNTQAVAGVTQGSLNVYANGAGTIQNTSGTTATLITVPGAATTFAGVITGGNINLDKQGAGAWTLLSANNLGTGSLTLRSAVTLRDSGTIAATGTIQMPFGSLTLDNSGLEVLGTSARIGTNAINMTGGTISFLAGSIPDTQTLGAVTINGGANVINNTIFASGSATGSSSVLTLAKPHTLAVRFSPPSTSPPPAETWAALCGTINAANTATAQPGSQPADRHHLRSNADNGIIGGWAVINGADFASYRSTVDPITGAFGVGNLGFSTNGQFAVRQLRQCHQHRHGK
jgi:autotransporter-associated beta strand protein